MNGPLFKAEEMEDKWDIYQFDDYLYFVRSWTDDLVLRASLRFNGSQAVIFKVLANLERVKGEGLFALQTADFLIKRLLYRYQAPHPLPANLKNKSPEELALFSFSFFGRGGLYGTFEDTLGS